MKTPRQKKFAFAKLVVLALGLVTFTARAQTAANFGNLPLFFEADSASHFHAQGRDAEFFVSPGAAQLVLRDGATARGVQMKFVNASPLAQTRGDGELPGKINHFTGGDPAQWRAAVPTFAQVRVDGIYPGINLVYYGNQRQVEYDLTVAAAASPDLIALQFDGTEKISINARGELVLKIGSREIFQPKPLIYQTVGGARKIISGGYKILDTHTVAFAIGKYDRALPLVIDPVLSYATYFGGNAGESAWSIAVSPTDGSVYVAGLTLSTQFFTNEWPTVGAFQTNFAGGALTGDAFVARFGNLGTNLIYFTYLGGSADDGALGVAVDAAGNAFVTGFTDSPDFPTTTNALYRNISGLFNKNYAAYPVDAFVAELNPGGSKLVYSTYLGGSSQDAGVAIAVDAADNAYVTGYSYSTNFPVTNAIQNRLACPYNFYTNCNAFVSEISSNGAALVFSTYLGGTNFDEGQSIALDASNYIYVAGFTASTNFPATNFIFQITTNLASGLVVTNNGQLLNGGTNLADDAFVAKFAPSGSNLVYSTLLGGANNDVANHIAVDAAGDAFVTGWTASTNFPNTVATNLIANFLTNNSSGVFTTNIFLAKITNAPGAAAGIAYSVTFGGNATDIGFGVAADAAGNAFVTGFSTSTNFPTGNTGSLLNATNAGGSDVFVTAFNTNASAVLYSVLLGGALNDSAYGIALDAADNAYVAGQTYSTANFATTNALQTVLNGADDTFLAKILLPPTSAPTLSITTSGTKVSVSWFGFEPEFILESSTNLGSGTWLTNGVTPVLTNNSSVVILPATNNAEFFRLQY
jgi:hypothetical protein